MKKALLMIACLFCAGAITASAQTAPKKQALRKQMVEKYDANKDGKLDKEEIAKISEADQKTLKEAGVKLGAARKKAQ